MNKLKVAVEALRDHLARDERGVNLLEQLTTIANEQRKRAAALERESANAVEAAGKLQRAVTDALAKIDSLKAAVNRERDKRVSAEARERLATAALQPPDEEPSSEDTTHDSRVLSLIKKVQRRFNKLPVRSFGRVGNLVVEDIIKSFSYSEFADLGMVMAACALVKMPVSIRAENPIVLGELANITQQAKFVHWFSTAIQREPQWKTDLFVKTDCGESQMPSGDRVSSGGLIRKH